MRVYSFHAEQFVPETLERVFAFFQSPENLEQLTPPQLRFSILTPLPIIMRKGALIEYRIRIRGVPQHWRTLISEYDPPHSFVDEQLSGPYARWIHRHTFTRVTGGTRLGDDVQYALPFGPLGRLAHALFVRREIVSIFEFRRLAIAERFGADHNYRTDGNLLRAARHGLHP